jgi:glycerophosphoryl diester phosphodiesterase
MRPTTPPLPPVIGHRGAAAHAPENTLAGFRAAKALGCAWVEFDVRLTADGALVLCHDDRLERTTDGRGRISKLSLAAIRQCDAGGWFGKAFVGERVPTLDEALGCCGELGLGANIEIKAERGQAAATAAAVAACLDLLPPRLPPILLSSFAPEAVAAAAAQAPHIPRGMLWQKVPRGWMKVAEQLDCTTVNADQAYLSQSMAAEICAAGYPLLAYTVNDPDRARQLFGWGTASVFSDAPDIIQTAAGPWVAEARQGARC